MVVIEIIKETLGVINSKEYNGDRKAHVKFSSLIMTLHTMEALPKLPTTNRWRPVTGNSKLAPRLSFVFWPQPLQL